MSKGIEILSLNNSFESYAFLVGYVMQKKPIDIILQSNDYRYENKTLIFQLNHWLKEKGYPLIIPADNSLFDVLRCSTGKAQKHYKEVDLFIENSNTQHIRCYQNKLELNNYQHQWGWDNEVLESVLNLSDLPDTTKKLIMKLNIKVPTDSLSIS